MRTTTWRALGSTLEQGALGVKLRYEAPVSAMAVSDSNMFGGGTAECVGGARDGGGVGLQPGLESKVAKAV